MLNTFVPQQQAAVAIERLRREIILPRYVTRLGLADYRGKINDTVNLRVPAILSARDYTFRTRSAEIELDEVTEHVVSVPLDTHIYSAVALTDEELTLDIDDFSARVLFPQIVAVAERIENLISTAMVNADYAFPAVVYAEDENSEGTPFYRALVEARRTLNAANVPQDGRVVLIGSDVEASALKEEDLRRADASGGTQTLRRGELGQLAGFTIVSTNSVPSDFGVAFHRSAFAFANAAPIVPEGVGGRGRSAEEGGIALRVIRDYDARYLRDRSVVSSFAGATSVEDAMDDHGDLTGENRRAVLIDFTAAGS